MNICKIVLVKFLCIIFFHLISESLYSQGSAEGNKNNNKDLRVNQSALRYSDQYIDLEVIPEFNKVSAGDAFEVAFKISHKKSWHTYWINPGGPGLPTKVKWDLPTGVKSQRIKYPKPERYSLLGSINYAYNGQTYLFSTIRFDEKLTKIGNNKVGGIISWLVCNEDTCVPGRFEFSFDVDVVENLDSNKLLKSNFERLDKKNEYNILDNFRNLPYDNNVEKKWNVYSSVVKDNKLFKYEHGKVFKIILEPINSDLSLEVQKIYKNLEVTVFPITEGLVDIKSVPVIFFDKKNEKYLIYMPLVEDLEFLKEINSFSGYVDIESKSGRENFHFSSQLLKENDFNKVLANVDTNNLISLSDGFDGNMIKGLDESGQEERGDVKNASKGLEVTKDSEDSEDIGVPFSSENLERSEEKTINYSLKQVSEIKSLWKAIIFGFLGGLILNLMPCVFPIISIKILSFVKQGGESRQKIALSGILYSLGILLSFLALALIFIKAKLLLGDSELSWAFQLQVPGFVLIMACLMFVLSLNLVGVFEFGFLVSSSAQKLEQNIGKKNEKFSSFISGVLAVAIATPCTGPFMGSAVAFALNNSSYVTFLVFTSLAIGFAFPYILLSIFPSFVNKLPRPGEWMVDFKKLLSIPMFITMAWLIWVLAILIPESFIGVLSVLFLTGIIFWILGTFASPIRGNKSILISIVISLFLTFLAYYVASETLRPNTIEWEEYSEERFNDYLGKNPILLDFTAAWCLTCNTNKLAFNKDKVKSLIVKNKIKLFRIDWTKRDQKTLKHIKKYGRHSIPLNVFYKKGSRKPKILPNFITPGILINTFSE